MLALGQGDILVVLVVLELLCLHPARVFCFKIRRLTGFTKQLGSSFKRRVYGGLEECRNRYWRCRSVSTPALTVWSTTSAGATSFLTEAIFTASFGVAPTACDSCMGPRTGQWCGKLSRACFRAWCYGHLIFMTPVQYIP